MKSVELTCTTGNRIVPQVGMSHDEAKEQENSFLQVRGPTTLDNIVPSIVHLDDNYCVIDKPPGIRMDGNFPITIEKLVAKWTQRGVKDIKWMHQLDFATSGVLCIGLHREAVAAVVSSFEHRTVRKAYLAVLQGHLRVEDWPVLTTAQAITYAQANDHGHSKSNTIPMLAENPEAVQTLVEEHRKSLVSVRRPHKRKLQDITSIASIVPEPVTTDTVIGDATTAADETGPTQPDQRNQSNLATVVDPGSTWQLQVMAENLRKCLHALHHTLTLDHVIATAPHLQKDYQQLLKYSEKDFLHGPRIRKSLRKLLQRCGISVEIVASVMSEAAEALPTAAAAIIEAVTPKPSTALTEEEVAEVCQEYRNIHREKGPAIFRVPTPATAHQIVPDTTHLETFPSHIYDNELAGQYPKAQEALNELFKTTSFASDNNGNSSSSSQQYHLLVDIPVAELEGDFRMEPGHAGNPGKKAVTEIFVLQHGYYQGKAVTKVLMKPISGRRHQLRIHAKCLGHPIVGDFTYNPLQRQGIVQRAEAYQQYVNDNGHKNAINGGHITSNSPPRVSSEDSQAKPVATQIPVAVRKTWDAQVAERMMLHAYCIHIPFPMEGKTSTFFKRQVLERELFVQTLFSQGKEERLVSEEEKQALRQQLKQQFDGYTATQIRQMPVRRPLIDLATPVDPFPFHMDSKDTIINCNSTSRSSSSSSSNGLLEKKMDVIEEAGVAILRPALPNYMQRYYPEEL